MSKNIVLARVRGRIEAYERKKQRKLDADEQRRFDKLTGLLAKLNAGQHVQKRDLQTWLTADEYQSMLDAGDEQKGIRKDLTEKPAAVLKYQRLLRAADFEFSKSNYYLGQHKYEDALLLLQEMLEENPSVRSWFDRDIEWTIDSDLDFDPALVPRVVTSVSGNRRPVKAPLGKLSIKDVKIATIERALDALTSNHSTPAMDEKKSEKLKQLLKLPDDEI